MIREIREVGAIAVTNHGHIEFVVLAVERYQELVGLRGALPQVDLGLLAVQFQARLERMQTGTIRAGAQAFMDDDGDFSTMGNPPIVGVF